MSRTVIDPQLEVLILKEYVNDKVTIKKLVSKLHSQGIRIGHMRIRELLKYHNVLRSSAESRRGAIRKSPFGEKKCGVVGCNNRFQRNSGSHKFCNICIPHAQARAVYNGWRLAWPAFSALLLEQNHRCAGCGCLLEQGKKKTANTLCIDHDHLTGKIRGLLCHRCNTILGHASDNVNTLRSLARYLERT